MEILKKNFLIFLCALCGNHEHMSVLQTNTESEHCCGMEWSWPARLQFRVHLQKRGVSLRPLQVVAIPISGPPPASKLFRQIHFLAIIFTAHMQMLSPPQNYVLCNHDALRGFETGSILDDHPLNTSDYLPVCCKINVSHVRAPPKKAFPSSPLDWKNARSEGICTLYSLETNNIVRPLLKKEYSSIDDLDSDIKFWCVADAVKMCVTKHIPAKNKKPINSRKVHD